MALKNRRPLHLVIRVF